MSKPMPPCERTCPKRRPGCQTVENCEKWGPYQEALAAWHRARQTFCHGRADVNAVRKKQLRTARGRAEMKRRKQGN